MKDGRLAPQQATLAPLREQRAERPKYSSDHRAAANLNIEGQSKESFTLGE